MKLFEYQNEAVQEVIKKINSHKREIRFQAPTGSGKTFMTAHIVKGINQSNWGLLHPKKTYLYIAPSTGALDHQGYKKITSYLESGDLTGYKTQYIDQTLSMDYLQKNTINFIGWGMIKKGSSLLRSNSERKTLYDIIDETHNKGIEIILIVDEAHREYKVKKTSVDFHTRHSFIESLNYIKSIEMSATLDGVLDVKVYSSDVKCSGVIKQSVIINSNTDLYEKDIIKSLIQSGIDKIIEIKKSILKTQKPNLNPLLFIQIPDGQPKINGKSINDFYLNIIKEMFDKNKYREGYDYAIWLDKKKTTKNKKEITKYNSTYKAIVFKQALATGWDVPRAHVLVKLRNPKKGSKSFEIQTIGRILRNPFLKVFKVYKPFTKVDVENLNNAFVYTNDKGWVKKGIENDYEGFLKADNGNFEISERALENSVKINTINAVPIKKHTSELIKNIILDKKNKPFFKELLNSIKKTNNDNPMMKTHKLYTKDLIEDKLIEHKYDGKDTKLGFAQESLFYIYITFLNTINSNKYILSLINLFTKHYKINKKTTYQYLINHYTRALSINGEAVLINREIIKMISKVFSNNTSYSSGMEFTLRDTINYRKIGLSSHPDGLGNSYKVFIDTNVSDISESAFQSDIEMQFYKNTISDISNHSNIHLFRNKTNPMNSYFSQYYNFFENRISSFYPDFILTTSDKVFIIECKGLGPNDIDKKTDSKMQSLWKNIENIEKDKTVYIFKVGRQKVKTALSYIHFSKKGFTKELTKTQFWNMVIQPTTLLENTFEKDFIKTK